MIENIRKYQGLILVVIVVLILGFVFMDTSGLFSQRAGGGGDYLQVDGRNYSTLEFNKSGRNALNLAQSLRSFDENGIEILQFTGALMAGAQTEETAAKNFFASRMVLREAFKEFGIQPSQQEIEKFIMGLQTFQERPAPGAPPGSASGEFDQAAYNNFIDNFIGRLGLREADLQALVSDVIATSKLREIIGGGLTVSRDLAETSSIINQQKVAVSVASIEVEPFRAEIEPSDEELEAFWTEVKDGYTTEKRIKVSYFIAAPEYPEESETSEEAGDENAANEKADAIAEAKTAADKKLALAVDSFVNQLTDTEGANFETLIQEGGWELISTDWFTRATLPDELKIQPRATSVGSSVVDQLLLLTTGPDALAPFSKAIAVGENEWFFARLDELEEPRVKTFEEAKDEIKERYIAEKADELLKEHVSEKLKAIKEALAADKSFAEAAKGVELEPTDLGPFGPSDTLDGGYSAGVLFTPASTVNPNELAEPIYTEEKAIILHVDKRQIEKDDSRGQRIDSEMSRMASDNQNRAFDAWLTQRLENAEVRDLTQR